MKKKETKEMLHAVPYGKLLTDQFTMFTDCPIYQEMKGQGFYEILK